MATIMDIALEVNTSLNNIENYTLSSKDTLVDINSDLADVKADVADIKTELGDLRFDVNTGFANLSAGLGVLINGQAQTNDLLDINREQNDTIICWLTNIADLLCRILHRHNTEIQLQTSMEDSITQIKETLELVHGEETVEVLRRAELREAVEVCCPPEEPPLEPCPEPCESPDYDQPDLKPPDFRPLDPPKPRHEDNPSDSGKDDDNQ